MLTISASRNSDVDNMDKFTHVIHNDWSTSYIEITSFIEDLGHFALMRINTIIEFNQLLLLRNIAFFIFNIIHRFMYCVAMRDERGSNNYLDCSSVYII